MAQMMYRDALRMALGEEMRRDPNVFIIGEEVGRYGGAYAVTRGLFEEFGAERVVDSPISEASVVGLGVGAALMGLRPVVELMYVDFVGLAMDQIANQMAKWRYMSGGRAGVPMVLRTQGGTGRSAGAQHSQSLEAWLVHIPGLRVVMPSNPADARGLLKTAIRSDDPVLFIEHKALYSTKGEVPEGDHAVPFGVAAILRPGKDVSIVSYSRMVNVAMEAASTLEKEGIDAEVLDLRTVSPLDMEAILASVRKTRRVVVVNEAHRTAGFCAELAARITENAFDILYAPVARVAAKDVPVPATNLEALSIPCVEEIAAAARLVARRSSCSIRS
jgi:pyruvate/2-oxoglutarate/acetoin dehydrogenase E1 component